jgi:hypothetical protein
MKRTMLAAVVVVILVLGVVAYATGQTTGDVAVTARVNPQISLTIAEDAASGVWSSLTPGTAATAKLYNFEVKSNKIWDFTYDGVVYLPDNGLLAAVLAPAGTLNFDADNVDIPKGVYTDSETYAIDMLGAAAYDLVPATDYTATYTYSVVQK